MSDETWPLESLSPWQKAFLKLLDEKRGMRLVFGGRKGPRWIPDDREEVSRV